MLPTSLPGAIPGGPTAARPTSPRAASAARVGIEAASSGVRPPSSATGSSAQPSGTQTTYFTGPVCPTGRGAPPRAPPRVADGAVSGRSPTFAAMTYAEGRVVHDADSHLME